MGEYAKLKCTGKEIKIGTCESMYYLRLEDTDRIETLEGNVDPAKDSGLFFRIPFPDEDNILPGSYQVHNRGLRLFKVEKQGGCINFSYPELEEEAGIIQFSNESGILINLKCYHGEKLPESTNDFKCFWNGHSWFYELSSIKKHQDKETKKISLRPVVRCRFCDKMWSFDWEDILSFVQDEKIKKRLIGYSELVF